jgi:hypothetical protein
MTRSSHAGLWLKSFQVLAEIIGSNSTAAITFNDQDSGNRNPVRAECAAAYYFRLPLHRRR